MSSSWNQKTSVEPDILALAKVIGKEGANFSQAIAQSAVGVALEILGPAAILARDIDNLPGTKKADSDKYSRHLGGKFNDLLSLEEATALINDLAKYYPAPLQNMSTKQCVSLYQTMVIDLAKKLVKTSLKKDSQFLTDEALDDVAQAVVQRNISSNMSYQSSLKPHENKLYKLSEEIENTSPLKKDDYAKISEVWGPIGLEASWKLVATTANSSLAAEKSKLASSNLRAANTNLQNSLEQTRQKLSDMRSGNAPASQSQLGVARQAIISADTLPLNVDFDPILHALPKDFGFKPLGVYNAAIEFAQLDFKLGDRMMGATKAGFTFKKSL